MFPFDYIRKFFQRKTRKIVEPVLMGIPDTETHASHMLTTPLLFMHLEKGELVVADTFAMKAYALQSSSGCKLLPKILHEVALEKLDGRKCAQLNLRDSRSPLGKWRSVQRKKSK